MAFADGGVLAVPVTSLSRFHAAGKRPRIAARNEPEMIQVSVPIDVNAVAASESGAFALATPLRVEDIVRVAIVTALGPRAPQDKRERVISRTLDGLCSREYVVEIDGRIYNHGSDIAVCAGVATLRFFLRRTLHRAA
jgi:hypothetical protein